MTEQERIEINNLAVSIMEGLELPEIFRAAKRIHDLTKDPQSGWIPCSERLPDMTDRYEVTWLDKADKTVYSDVEPFFADTRQWHYEFKADPSVEPRFVVIAWRKRPEPYQGEA